MSVKPVIEHRDRLGRTLLIGDCVAYPNSNSLEIGTIKKLNPKMIKVKRLGSQSKWGESNKYPQDVVKLEGAEVSMYLLKNSS